VGLLALYVCTAAVAVGALATFDATKEIRCIDCLWRNPFLVHWQPGIIRAWQQAGAALHLATALAAALSLIAWRALAARRNAGRTTLLAGLLGLAGATALGGAALLFDPTESLELERWRIAWGLLALAALALAVGVCLLGVETWLRVARMRRLVTSLEAAPAPGALEAVLRSGLGDGGLRIAFQLESGALVDGSGAPVRPAPGDGHVLTPVVRDGVELAIVTHAASVDPRALAGAFGPTVLVALDNERLRAARLAQLTELRASRARIVAVGDAERRRLERDLHDGVQQQLLSLLFDVRLARLAAEREGDRGRAERLTVAEGHAQAAVDELRRIAHGVHPAVLSRSGLGPALASLAEEAPLPVEVAADRVGRLPEAVEAAAYQAVAETVADAAARGAGGVEVRARLDAGVLRLEVRQEGDADAGVPVRIADRVGAAGGEVSAEALPTGGTLLRVELPCA
jgi:signal transduction histidine kinase